MAGSVLGLGRQRSVLNVLALLEAKITKTSGPSRIISAKSKSLDFVAERSGFEGDFESITLNIRDAESLASLAEIEAELDTHFDHSQDNGAHIYSYPRTDTTESNGLADAIALLTNRMKLPEVWRFEGREFQSAPISVELLFKAVVQYKASDIHLIPGRPPIFRIDNQLRVSELMGNLSSRQIEDLIEMLASDSDWTTFREKLQCTFSFHHVGIGYARVSAFIKAGAPHLTFRFLPEKIPSFDDLGLDKEMMLSFSNMSDGLLLIAGMTGSGKTSTCAAVVDWINENKSINIVCLEDPVEYIHQSKKGFISQREAGVDVNSIGDGVKGVTHQDTNVLFIGEMNDVETIRGALNAASTGTLVISTIHSSTASGAVTRHVSLSYRPSRVPPRPTLEANLTGVICQKLVPKIKGGRIPAIEVLFNDVKNIADAIKQGNTAGIRLGMQHSLSESKLFEKHLHELYKADKISLETAREHAPEISMFDQLNMGTYKTPRMESG